jgi:hypothetical protein
MKKFIIICLTTLCTITAVHAQNICGTWAAETTQEGTCYYKFYPNGRADLVFKVRQTVTDGIDACIFITMPGHYLIEGGKSLTVAFQKDKSTFSANLVYGNDEIKAKFETPEGQVVEKQLKDALYGSQDQIMGMVKLAVPASYLYQIIYMNQRYISVVNAAVGLKQRYDLERVGDTDAAL